MAQLFARGGASSAAALGTAAAAVSAAVMSGSDESQQLHCSAVERRGEEDYDGQSLHALQLNTSWMKIDNSRGGGVAEDARVEQSSLRVDDDVSRSHILSPCSSSSRSLLEADRLSSSFSSSPMYRHNTTLRDNFRGALNSASHLVEGLIERRLLYQTESEEVEDGRCLRQEDDVSTLNKKDERQLMLSSSTTSQSTGSVASMSPFSAAVFTRLGDHLFSKSVDKEMLRDCVAAAKEVVASDAVMNEIERMGTSRSFSFSAMRGLSSSTSTSTSTSTRSYTEESPLQQPMSEAELKEEIGRLAKENEKLRARYEALTKDKERQHGKERLKAVGVGVVSPRQGRGKKICSKAGKEEKRPGLRTPQLPGHKEEEREDHATKWVDIVKAIVGVICAVAFVIARKR